MKKQLFFQLAALAIVCVPCAPVSSAQRRPVLPQIELPHPYYYRELYLPQLTSGPSSVAWAPDSKEVVYSMAGSLWRQKLDSTEAIQITDGTGYDYQPDWSPDGKSIIYVSYQKDAMELWLLDVASGQTSQLTTGGAVNVEPRWSPDGRRIIFVSTVYNKRFHIFRADFANAKLEDIVRLTGETKSDLPRYYYSAYDTEINPVWTRDGGEILFISNKGHIHGSGGFWRMKAEPGASAREIHYEETNWKARPDFSPDGSRMVYSSYLGGQWHNFWLMPANGGDAFPISYGDWDHTNVRWSPDGRTVAFISNQNGATQLCWQEVLSADHGSLGFDHKRFLRPHAVLAISVSTKDRDSVPARISVTDEAGKSYAPDRAWVFADDGIDAHHAMEAHYFYGDSLSLDVPKGKITIEITHGPEFRSETRTLVVNEQMRGQSFLLQRLAPLEDRQGKWIGADLHVHENYGGTYKSTGNNLVDRAEAEDLAIVHNLIVNKEQRFPDIALAEALEDRRDPDQQIVGGQEFHTSYWGHRGLLGMKDHILLPGYAGYPNTAASSLFPMNADVYDMAHSHGALVGAVHPFDAQPDPFATPAQRITDELPVDVALGKIDYMEIVGFSDHKSTAAVWYRLLNLGFRIPAGAGTDATTNYAAPIRGMIGFNRVYTWVPSWPLHPEMWTDGFKRGRTFATNGPLLGFTLNAEMVGSELKLNAAQDSVPYLAQLRSNASIDHLQIVCNGKIVQEMKLAGDRKFAEMKGTIPVTQSGWCVLRAFSDQAEAPVMDSYAYATTSPIYLNVAGAKPRSPEDAKYFAAWIGHIIEITEKYPDWNSPQEKELVMKRLRDAQAIYTGLE